MKKSNNEDSEIISLRKINKDLNEKISELNKKMNEEQNKNLEIISNKEKENQDLLEKILFY